MTLRDVSHLRLSEWPEDYTWRGQLMALHHGYMLPYVPDGWVRLSVIAMEIGGTRCVPWLLGSSERPAEIVQQAGIYDRCRWDEYWELICSPQDAMTLRAHAKPMWERRSGRV